MKKHTAKTKKSVRQKSESSSKDIAQVAYRLPSSWRMLRAALQPIWTYRVIFAGILLVYIALNFILVQGVTGNGTIARLRDVIDGNVNEAVSSVSLFLTLVGSTGNAATDIAGVYQNIILILTALALIWALRQVTSGTYIRVRDAFYNGMHPLIPVLIIVFLMTLQLIPALVGSYVYGVVVQNGIAATILERILWSPIAIGGLLLSTYWVIASVFALLIVTLPDVAPLQAFRSARALVKRRRWTILRKLLLLPVVLYGGAAIIMVPIIIFMVRAAEPVYFVLSSIMMLVAISYIYTLYRELLHE